MFNQNNQYNSNNQYSVKKQSGFSGCIGCIGMIVFLAILGIVGINAYLYFQNQPLPLFLQSLFFNSVSLIAMLVLTAAVIILVAVFLALHGKKEGSFLGRLISSLFGLSLVAVFGGSAIWYTDINPHLNMTRTAFDRSLVNLTANGKILFSNPADGVTQILCVGVNQHCVRGEGDPAELDRGLVIQPGQTVTIFFNTDGNYQITSKTTPHMNTIISVATADSGD